jgi:hypothetical protein
MSLKIHSAESIANELVKRSDAFESWIRTQDDQYFEQEEAPGKWSTGQHLDHMLRSVKPVNMALGLPAFIPKLMFGKMNRPGRQYDALVNKYAQKLAEGGRASGPYVPPDIKLNQKEKLLKNFHKQSHGLAEKARKKSDSYLDEVLLPHPLLGKLSMREMLFFSVHHVQHHLDSLRTRLPH